jgi:predicted ester cyclase/pimeloyl-ACP methyl ester carboxylesterase
MTNQWPADTLSREAFAAALQTIGVPETNIAALAPAGRAGLVFPDQAQLLVDFVKAAATPEQRQTLSKAAGCIYKDLTKWVVRADLLRIGKEDEAMNAGIAELLESAGVKGVHDLAACVEHPQRLAKLQKELYHLINSQPLDPLERQSLKSHLRLADLERFGKGGRELESFVTAEVSVILVVKGAGEQKPDETLDVFLNGFWPAMKSVDSSATIAKRRDIFPSDYRSSAYDKEPLNHITEIRTGERRIWLKEPNWEAALVPTSPWDALFKEWRLATYAFGKGIHDLFTNPDSHDRHQQRSFWRYYIAFALMYLLIFGHIGLTFVVGRAKWGLPQGLLETGNLVLLGQLIVGVGSAALIAAILPAIKTDHQMKIYLEDGGRLEGLPGVSGLVVLLLIATFLLNPANYVLWLLFVLVIELALLLSRGIAWPYRKISNSDSWSDHYYSVAGKVDQRTGKLKIFKWSNSNRPLILTVRFLRMLFVLMYRYIVVISLPISFVGFGIAQVLKWTRLLGGIGEGLEKALNVALSGFLGDVVTYATNPAQAHRVRQVVETDLKFFHNRPEVSHIHVFAHSQGTPITFETLFNHLPGTYRRKVKTYVTVGSVLSYYNQVNAVLDKPYVPRFPVRSYPKNFAEGFKWMNFWNLADPITEFYGLDEYNLVEEAPVFALEKGERLRPISLDASLSKTKRDPVSPTNIKTRATLENHAEYWSNQDHVHVPFALRVLGVWRPQQWNPEKLKTLKWFGLRHYSYVSLWWALWAAVFLTLFYYDIRLAGWLVDSIPFKQGLTDLISAAIENLSESQGEYVRAILTATGLLAQAVALRYVQEILAVVIMLAVPFMVALPLAGFFYVLKVVATAIRYKRPVTLEETAASTRRLYEEIFTDQVQWDKADIPDSLKNSFGKFRAAFSDPCAVVEEVVADGDKVVAWLTLSGVHDKSGFGGFALDDQQHFFTATITHHVEDSRIKDASCEVYYYWHRIKYQ